jgi:hypothetical protein
MNFKTLNAVYSDNHNNPYKCFVIQNAEFRYVKSRGTYSNHSSLNV